MEVSIYRPIWAIKPSDVGSLALSIISGGCKRNPVLMAPLIEPLTSKMIEWIDHGPVEYREHSVAVLFHHADSDRYYREDLVSKHIFLPLTRFITSEKAEFRHICAILCSKIYRNNTNFQQEFMKNRGVFYLMQLITMGVPRGKAFMELCICLIDLILVIAI